MTGKRVGFSRNPRARNVESLAIYHLPSLPFARAVAKLRGRTADQLAESQPIQRADFRIGQPRPYGHLQGPYGFLIRRAAWMEASPNGRFRRNLAVRSGIAE